MIYECHTDKFHLEYIESEITRPVLWENHTHAQYEMIAVADGDVTVIPEGQQYRLIKNQIIIIPPLCYHSVTANGKGAYRRITAMFDSDAIPDVLRAEFEGQVRESAIAASQIEKLRNVCQRNAPSFFAPLMQSLMTELFYDTVQTPIAAAQTETDDFIQKTIRYVEQHLHQNIRLDHLAKHTSRSKSSFCHLFEQKMNISPKQYILQKKLAYASKLISEGMPITAAAMQVGYDNYSNFYRLYKKHFGTAPKNNK